MLGRQRRLRHHGNEDIDFEPDQLCREIGKPVELLARIVHDALAGVRHDQAAGAADEQQPHAGPGEPSEQRLGHGDELLLAAGRRPGRTDRDILRGTEPA
jgi:hypothetical protein